MGAQRRDFTSNSTACNLNKIPPLLSFSRSAKRFYDSGHLGRYSILWRQIVRVSFSYGVFHCVDFRFDIHTNPILVHRGGGIFICGTTLFLYEKGILVNIFDCMRLKVSVLR